MVRGTVTPDQREGAVREVTATLRRLFPDLIRSEAQGIARIAVGACCEYITRF